MKKDIILIFIFCSIFSQNQKVCAQLMTAGSNVSWQIPGSDLSIYQNRLNLIDYKRGLIDKTIKINTYQAPNRNLTAVAAGSLIVCGLSLVMGTISAFDQGIDSKSTIFLFSLSAASGGLACLAISLDRKKRRR